MYQLSKAHPIPQSGGKQVFPFDEMEVGDSFDVPAPHGNQTLRVRSARVAATKRSKNSTQKFTSKLVGDVVRFWRVK